MPRLKGSGSGNGASYHHCLSRIVGREFLLKEKEKTYFVVLMRRLEAFHGCRILTYCVMSNHFHLLLEMPDPAVSKDLGKDEIRRRIQILYGDVAAETFSREIDQAVDADDQIEAKRILDRFRCQMGDLSVYMKQLKQRFSVWYNHRRDRKGTLWEERYKSVLIENDMSALTVVAAYIDLNPLRAGMVQKVEEYQWCGYSSAVGGNHLAREGIGRIYDLSHRVSGEDFAESWKKTGPLYRLWLHGEGEIRNLPAPGETVRRKGFSREEVEAEVARGGKLPISQVLRVKVRYFSDGLVLGSEAFVDDVYERNEARFGTRRTSGAREMKGAEWGHLRIIRELRTRIFG